ncbi:glyoxalase superfamily protein [Sabulicella rubraurantiaca]|uniref:glyoxalase superfamily protein n=1 Tax=Sabulicella rubraurantiaca TaxID=2811429 RepID=UPI002E2AAF1B|nr:glyoxalase superfamily protein [Sabulicella rubraurantiaca]
MTLRGLVPILRIFDAELARGFYVEWLGFRWDWEHRFEPDLPLYAQISRDGVALHLSMHHGDATPGSALRLHCDDVDALHASLAPRSWARPSVEDMPWGERAMRVTDPFGNRLHFFSPKEA